MSSSLLLTKLTIRPALWLGIMATIITDIIVNHLEDGIEKSKIFLNK